jgi:SH3-like domain-containing protein
MMMEALWIVLFALAPATAPPARTCDIRAYVADDVHALEIREQPSAKARVLRTIAPDFGVAHVVGRRGGWFRVDGIVSDESDATLFAGDGWVPASALGTDISGSGDRNLYKEPRPDSAILATPLPDGGGAALLDCAGTWARIRFHDSTGWLAPSGQCSSALTTCP